jgi:hypothetical protein
MNWKYAVRSAIPELLYNYLLYFYLHLKVGRWPTWPKLREPVTFNEKTIWLKMHFRHPQADIVADKVAVREFVRSKIGSEYLIPCLGVFETIESIDMSKLPNAFVLKASHGSDWNIICRDKSRLDVVDAYRRMRLWLGSNYGQIGKEYQYLNIPPRIICETLLGNSDAELIDYKIFCFDAIPRFIQVDFDRFTQHTRLFYNVKWELMPFTTLFPRSERRLPCPALLADMLNVASKLASGFVFVRVDLYVHEERLYFGEMTLHHGGGFEPFMPREFDEVLGHYIKLDALAA